MKKHMLCKITGVCLFLCTTAQALTLVTADIIPVTEQFLRCTDINYCSKGTTVFGKRYYRYVVRCSDGSKREITAWGKDRKKWCVDKTRQCTDTQVKAARMACQ